MIGWEMKMFGLETKNVWLERRYLTILTYLLKSSVKIKISVPQDLTSYSKNKIWPNDEPWAERLP